jgi:hypothetical protein
MLLRKPLFAVTAATIVAAAALSPKAAHAADPLLGALIGGGIGAAIGDGHGRHGAGTGAAIGAILGTAIAADSNRYYGDRYYDGYDRGYYAPAPAYGYSYYAPAPVYYGPSVVISSYPSYRHRHHYSGHRHWDGGHRWR